MDNINSQTSNENVNISLSNQKKLEQKVDNIEQSNKRNNLRFLGIQETNNENMIEKIMEICQSKMKICLRQDDITVAYRVGQKSSKYPRHVVVIFKDNKTKTDVYSKKKMLKETGCVVKEDLTALRVKWLKETAEKYGFKNTWTSNGNIFAKTDNGVEKIFS